MSLCTEIEVFLSEAFRWPLAFRPEISEARLSSVFAAIIAIALVCLDHGAFSLDAVRHGHREIIIPQKPKDLADQLRDAFVKNRKPQYTAAASGQEYGNPEVLWNRFETN